MTPVDDVDLEVGAEEMVVLLGPSGCGKTTLLRTLLGDLQPLAGEVTLGGRRVAVERPRVRTADGRA